MYSPREMSNREAEPEKRRGRPPKALEPLSQVMEAPPVMVPNTVLPHICPKCGRGQTPKILGKRPNGDRDVQCNSCGGSYIYTPASIRVRGETNS